MPKFTVTLLLSLLLIQSAIYGQVDTTIGLTAPGNVSNDVNALASFLTIDLKTEKEKANAIYNWVTHNISYDVEALKKSPKYREDEVGHALKTRKAVCEGYSQVFTELCRAAGLKAVTVEGYAKDWIFDNGDEIHLPRHKWSAVKINGKWQLVDATWGAGGMSQSPEWWRKLLNKISRKKTLVGKNLKFRFHYDTTYFSQDPETFRLKHLPSDPLWQLTDSTMPIAIFEAGDSAVKSFNKLYSNPKQDDPRLDRIATFDEKQKIFEFADRAYAYNNRYPAVLALKNTYRAEAVVKKLVTDSTVQSGDLMLKDAVNNLKVSLDYIKQQKKAFPDEYNKLKKKNKAKTQEAKQHIRLVRTDDKRLMADCNKHSKSITSKHNSARKKAADFLKKGNEINPGKIASITLSKIRKKMGSPELTALKDSVESHQIRIDTLRQTINTENAAVRATIVASASQLDTMVTALNEEDSMLRQEAIERLGMHDSYDDEVKKWSDLFKKQKYHITDTVLKNYFATFDTVVKRYEDIQAKQTACTGLYKSNLTSLEKYRKWNTTDTGIYDEYKSWANEYRLFIDTSLSDFAKYDGYLKANEMLFNMLAKLCKRQIAIVDFMEKAETSRQALEEKSISKKKSFDIKENDLQKAGIQARLKQLQDVVKEIDR